MQQSSYRLEYTKNEKRFVRISFITICSLFLLILAGGIVRSTGSGMGCPDWPRCFGEWVPPTTESSLPNNYSEQYLQQRLAKTERFAATLDALGFDQTAEALRKDPNMAKAETFNVYKTYTEYINRLIGALTGLFMLLMLLAAFTIRKKHPQVLLLSVLILILTLFQAWFGSIVVSTNLVSWTITLHMVLAIIILLLTILAHSIVKYTHLEVVKLSIGNLRYAGFFAWALLVLSMLQIIWGTELRERIDYYADFWQGTNRASWVELAGGIFSLHRSFSVVLVLLAVYTTWYVRIHFGAAKRLRRFSSAALIVLILQVLSGTILANFALPSALQPLHLILACVFVAALWMQILMIEIYKRNIALDLIS
jgi:cytochrome c oxidase assembly protein subunit 15